MPTERITRMKQRLLDTRPSISAERMLLATRAYQKYAGEATPIFRAKVFAYVLDHMSVVIGNGELIVGNQNKRFRCASIFPEYTGQWLREQIDTLPTRPNDPLEVPQEECGLILKCLDWWKGKSLEEQAEQFLPEDVQRARAAGIISVGSRTLSTGHTTPDYRKLLQKGFSGLIEDCRRKISETGGGTCETQEQIDFWTASIISCGAVIRFAGRYAALAEEMAEKEDSEIRKKELLKIAENCRRVPENPPRSFYEALQFVWFVQLLFHVESNSSANCFGRFDVYMAPFYQRDTAFGILTEERAKELIECLYIKATELLSLRPNDYSKDFAGYPLWQILMIGGVDGNGRDVTNPVSYLVLDAAAEIQLAQPAIALRVHDATPEPLFRKAVKMVQAGMANPAFFNDKAAIPLVLKKGGTLEEARNWVIIGCIEPHQGGGGTDASPSAGYLNLPKCLELVLHNGIDPLTGKQLGPRTGDPKQFRSKEEVMEALTAQMHYFWDLIHTGFNRVIPYHATRLPAIFASDVIEGCIEKGKPVQRGGAQHTYSGIFPTGPASLTDSLAALFQAVFEEKIVTMERLIHALDHNFAGEERLRLYLLNRVPKFGNNIPAVDELHCRILHDCTSYTQTFRDARGGRYCLCNQAQTVNVTQGSRLGATPDGRFAFAPLSDNSSPAMGRDVNGPTAAVNSVGIYSDQLNAWDGTLFNLRFDPRGVAGEKGTEIVGGVIREYFSHSGLHIQINVVNNETLRKAQEDPENYRNIIVRVAGYMAYFTELDRKVQDTIIERTAHLA